MLEEVRQVPYLVSLEAENLLLHPPYPALPNYAASRSSACPLRNGRAMHGHRSLLKPVDGTHIHNGSRSKKARSVWVQAEHKISASMLSVTCSAWRQRRHCTVRAQQDWWH